MVLLLLLLVHCLMLIHCLMFLHLFLVVLCLESCFVLFDFILNVPSTIFQLNRDWSSWVIPVLSQDKSVLLEYHNAVMPVRLEPAAPRSRVKHSTTEPLHSLSCFLFCNKVKQPASFPNQNDCKVSESEKIRNRYNQVPHPGYQ